ncbi:MAG: permease [Candidatus Marinimicrobia bacterium]|nr:permease [Candidatus Neomarinimicrobiota bacterium]MCF7904454.1 permease [Candidatus Neomarinimicrobiota bacterium]
MEWRSEWKHLTWIVGLFLLAYFLPLENTIFLQSLHSALELAKWYAREHVLLCLIPAFFIAGTIAVFISQNAVIKYLGAGAKKWISYALASVSGSILAVCSCTVLPLFTGIYKRGAGLGPATAFLYSGPAINIMAIILTARVLGYQLGLARIIGAVLFSIIIGILMQIIFSKEEAQRNAGQMVIADVGEERPIWQTMYHFVILVLILISATWGPGTSSEGAWAWIYAHKWIITSTFGIGLGISLIRILNINWIQVVIAGLVVAIVGIISRSPLLGFVTAITALTLILSFQKNEAGDWLSESWGFAKQILPLLAIGVLVAGFLLGTPENGGGIIPERWVVGLVGGNSIWANLFASIVGAFMYFATLTEIPILQGLINSGMGDGPALALLLAGPALSLPNMLVIRGVLGNKKTAVYILLVVLLSTVAGMVYGLLVQ